MDFQERQNEVMKGGGNYSKAKAEQLMLDKAEEERMESKEMSEICETAPYPWCNNAEGCDTCEHGGGR